MKTLRKIHRNEKGYSLLFTTIILLLGTLIITPLLSFTGTGLKVGMVHDRKMLEFYAADAGLQDAVWQVNNSALLLPQSSDDDPWVYSIADVNNKNVNVSIEYIDERTYKITSIATDSNGSTTIESYVRIYTSLFDYAAVALNGNLTMSGQVDIDSHPEPNLANIYANGDILLEGSVTVYGSATATGEVTVTGGSSVTGDITEFLDPPLEFYEINTLLFLSEANRGELIEGDLRIDTPTTLGPAHITGNLDLTSNAVVTLAGTVWVDGEITTDGSASVCGVGTLVAVGDIKISGGGEVAPENIPVIISTEGGIKTAGNRTVGAVLYATNGTIDVSGGAGVFGAIFGKEVIIRTSCTQAYAPILSDPRLMGTVKILTWETK